MNITEQNQKTTEGRKAKAAAGPKQDRQTLKVVPVGDVLPATVIPKAFNRENDTFTIEDVNRAMGSLGTLSQNIGKGSKVLGWNLGAVIARGVSFGAKQKDLIEGSGLTQEYQSVASKAQNVVQAFSVIADPNAIDQSKLSDSKRENLVRNVANLERFLQSSGMTGPQIHDLASRICSPDGSVRSSVMPTVLEAFGGVDKAYQVAVGNRVHPSDEVEVPEADEPSSDRKDKTVDELLAELEAMAGRCLRAGASVTDVVARVNSAAKAGQAEAA